MYSYITFPKQAVVDLRAALKSKAFLLGDSNFRTSTCKTHLTR